MRQGTVNAKKKGKTHEKGHKNQALSHFTPMLIKENLDI